MDTQKGFLKRGERRGERGGGLVLVTGRPLNKSKTHRSHRLIL